MWFEKLMGFIEESPEQVRSNIIIEGNEMISKINSKRFFFGELEIPTLQELRNRNNQLSEYKSNIQVNEIVGNVQDLHNNINNSNSLFQAASQFNLLEMIGPSITPEAGVDRYEFDYTQGPICAISCGAGTIFRNYFVEVNGKLGQSANNQINCLDIMGKALNNKNLKLWEMHNGYSMFNESGLNTLNNELVNLNQNEREALKGKLMTGIQWNTEVTSSENHHRVSQIYCSALPIAYHRNIGLSNWEPFARIILEATYESTLHAAVINMEKNNSNQVYLTLVGGGAFGNQENWILESIQNTIRKFMNVPLDIKIVSYGKSNPRLLDCIRGI